MNPLGFRSAIYQLADAGSSAVPMGDVAADFAARANAARHHAMHDAAAPQFGELPVVERVAGLLSDARVSYSGALRDARGLESGAARYTTQEQVSRRLDHVSLRLKQVTEFGASGNVAGHANEARVAAERVSASLRAAPQFDGTIDEATHMQLWTLRNGLDQAWNALGMDHVMGRLG